MSEIIKVQREKNLEILSGLQDVTLNAVELFKIYQKTKVANKEVMKHNLDFVKAYAKARQAQTAEMQATALIIEKTVQRGDYSRDGAAKDYCELGVIDAKYLLSPKETKKISNDKK